MLKKSPQNKAMTPPENKAQGEAKAFVTTTELATIKAGGQSYFLALGQIVVTKNPIEIVEGDGLIVDGLPCEEEVLTFPATDGGAFTAEDGIGHQWMHEGEGLKILLVYIPFGRQFDFNRERGRFFAAQDSISVLSAIYLPTQERKAALVEKIEEAGRPDSDARVVYFLKTEIVYFLKEGKDDKETRKKAR